MKYERIKFLVIALRDSIEIYAWAPKPYHKFMAFKSFSELQHKPLLVDLTVEEGTRLKVLYGSANGFHAVDLDSAQVYDIYTPKHAQGAIVPHTIVTLPNSNGMQLLLCYDNEGVYVNTYGKVSKNIVLQVKQLLTLSEFLTKSPNFASLCSGANYPPPWPTSARARSWAGAIRPLKSGR